MIYYHGFWWMNDLMGEGEKYILSASWFNIILLDARGLIAPLYPSLNSSSPKPPARNPFRNTSLMVSILIQWLWKDMSNYQTSCIHWLRWDNHNPTFTPHWIIIFQINVSNRTHFSLWLYIDRQKGQNKNLKWMSLPDNCEYWRDWSW